MQTPHVPQLSRRGAPSSTRVGRKTVGSSSSASRSFTAPVEIAMPAVANVELRTSKAVLETYYVRFMEVEKENQKLREDIQHQEEDALTVVACLERKLEEAKQEASHYKSEAARLLAIQQEMHDTLQKNYQGMLADRDKQIADYADIAGRLQGDLCQASRYIHERQAHTLELKALRESMEEMTTTHEKELTALRFQTIDRKMKLVAMEKVLRENFQSMVETESLRQLDTQAKALIDRNKSLETEKVTMAGEIEDLMQLTNVINTERTAMKREADLHKQAHEEVLRHTVFANLHGRESELKIQRLEEKVGSLQEECNAIKHDLASQYEGTIAQLHEELKVTRATLQTHRVELKRTRQLASTVVGQRTDLEKFFYVALEDCRRYRSGKQGMRLGELTVASLVGSAGNNTGGHRSTRTLPSSKAFSRKAQAAPGATCSFSLNALSRDMLASPAQVDWDGISSTDFPVSYAGTQSGCVHTSAALVPREATGKTGIMHTVSLARERREAPLHPIQLPPTYTAPTSSPLLPGSSPMPPNASYFEELTWEDKEKVIKALLFFINANYYRSTQLPATELGDDLSERLAVAGAAVV